MCNCLRGFDVVFLAAAAAATEAAAAAAAAAEAKPPEQAQTKADKDEEDVASEFSSIKLFQAGDEQDIDEVELIGSLLILNSVHTPPS